MHAAEEGLPQVIERQAPGFRARAVSLGLGAIILLTTVVRVWVIRRYPEPDSDAPGHLGIAAALLSHPLRVSLHWVYPPAYHYLLAALLASGVTAQGVRLLNCALAALLPVLVWRYSRSTLDPSASSPARRAPLLAGVLCAAMPIVNLYGTSAQPATLFTILVLSAVWSIDAGRFALGGGALALAALVRYEAWGAVGLLAGLRAVGFVPALARRLPAPLQRACRLPIVVVVPSLVAVAGWFLAHRVSDGTWLGFVREIYRCNHEQREGYRRGLWTDLLWFPVMQPYYLFGLTLPLFLLGARRAWRVGCVVPLGIYLFLLMSYSFEGALGSGRYYESLTPFVCVSAAHGACVIGERWRSTWPLAFAAALAHLVWLAVLTGRWTFQV